MDIWRRILLLLACIALASAKLRIIDLNVPSSIENGVQDVVILDCDFEASADEEGLEVKWFYGEDEQIYQWIPKHGKPQALGSFKDRIDLSYKASSDPTTMYRALRLTDVSPALSGDYKCKITSFVNEDTATKKMIIYDPADAFEFIHMDEEDMVICTAHGVYPEPELVITMISSNGTSTTFGEIHQARDTDGDGIPDHLDDDDDNDGIPDDKDQDDDNDGIPDNKDPDRDTDGDGIPDLKDDDDDNDGIPDTEDDDDDGDGIPDTEDKDHIKDSDGDGIPDVLDNDDDNDGIPDNKDDDDDGDGIPDAEDKDHASYAAVPPAKPRDTDGDGIPDHLDNDDDNDGIPDDKDDDDDGDGVLDKLDADRDTDGDGIPDIKDEDDDNDGIPDAKDTDDDNDGIPDSEDKDHIRDTDGDGIPDHLDDDDDNDGIPDDKDKDDDNDGIPDTKDKDHRDTDGDGVPDHIDFDDDNDGVPDTEDDDDDGDGIPDAEDRDGDYSSDDEFIRIQNDDKTFNLTRILSYRKMEISGDTKFICELTIPDTTYKLRKAGHVYTGVSTTTETQIQSEFDYDSLTTIATNPDDTDDAKTWEDNGSWHQLPSITLLLATFLLVFFDAY